MTVTRSSHPPIAKAVHIVAGRPGASKPIRCVMDRPCAPAFGSPLTLLAELILSRAFSATGWQVTNGVSHGH